MKFRDYIIETRTSYRDIAKPIDVCVRSIYRWYLGEIPHALVIAQDIERLTDGRVTMQSLADEARAYHEKKLKEKEIKYIEKNDAEQNVSYNN